MRTVRSLLEELQEFVTQWTTHFKSVEPGPDRPQNGNKPLTLTTYRASDELRSFIGLYICRSSTRRYWLESECNISFLLSGDSRQLCLQFDGNGETRESHVAIDRMPAPLFVLDTPWRDSIKKDCTTHCSDEACMICLDHPANRGHITCCSHVFCATCILRWSEVSNTCPICKRVFDRVTAAGPVRRSAPDGRGNRKRRRVFRVDGGSRERGAMRTQGESSNGWSHGDQILDCEYWYDMCFNERFLSVMLTWMEEYITSLRGGGAESEAEALSRLDIAQLRPQVYRLFLVARGIQPSSRRCWRLYVGECVEYEPPPPSGASPVTESDVDEDDTGQESVPVRGRL